MKENDDIEIEDVILLAQIKVDSHEAFEALFRKYYADVCACARRYVSVHEAEDIAQTCFAYVWEMRMDIDIKQSFRQYLFTMVYHRSLKTAMRRRAENNIAAYLDKYRREHELDETDFVSEGELRRRIRDVLDALPSSYREAFIMHRFEGKSYKEIAEYYGKSAKTIDYRIQQALKILRQSLRDYLPAVLVAVAMAYFEAAPEKKCDAETPQTEIRV